MNNEAIFVSKVFLVVKSNSYIASPIFEIVNRFANLNGRISNTFIQKHFNLIFTTKGEKKFDIFPLHTATNMY